MNLNGATIAIIGGTGFVGRMITTQLARKGARIKVLARNPDRARFLKPMGDIGQIAIYGGDALDDSALMQVIDGADAVVNTIGILAESGRSRFASLQDELPKRIGVIAAERNLKRVIHISAIGANAKAKSRYAASKGRGESNLKRAFPEATILRPSLIFGSADSFFNRFAAMAVLAPCLPVVGGGRNKIQPVFVGDVADAAVACLERDETCGKTYELGGPQVMTFREAMAYIVKQTHRRCLLIRIPYWIMMLAALPLGLLPNPPVTRDQLRQLKDDNIVSKRALGLADLGVEATSIDLIVPEYLSRYRPGGQFSGATN